jgi:hypothetical protein
MSSTVFSKSFTAGATAQNRWSLSGLLRALFSAHREMSGITALARRERLQQGYRHIPRRVWDRRSALFIEGRRQESKA